MLNLSEDALALLRQHVAQLDQQRAGLRVTALMAATKLLNAHDICWADIFAAALGSEFAGPPASSSLLPAMPAGGATGEGRQ